MCFPIPAAILGALYFIGRGLYTWGYLSHQGADKRGIGAGLSGGALFVNMGLCISSAIKLIRLVPK